MTQPGYAVPALDKALDILELLADEPGGLAQSEIAEATGRSVGQIFRVLVSLERRGYLVRERGGRYLLGTRLFDLAHRHAPLRGLEAVAVPIMRELAEGVRQSCNLAVLEGDRVRVVAQVESPADFGYRVRVGALFDVAGTAIIVTNDTPKWARCSRATATSSCGPTPCSPASPTSSPPCAAPPARRSPRSRCPT